MHVFKRSGVEIFHLADHRPRIGVALRIRTLRDQFVSDRVGLVFALALLVLHHAALLVELGLVHRPEHVAHAVRFHPQSEVESRGRHVLEVVGAVLVGRAVEVGGADAFHRLEVVVVEVLGSVEHQVLEQMREACLAGLFILGTDVVPNVDRNDRSLAVLMHEESESVVQNELLERNFDLAGKRRG